MGIYYLIQQMVPCHQPETPAVASVSVGPKGVGKLEDNMKTSGFLHGKSCLLPGSGNLVDPAEVDQMAFRLLLSRFPLPSHHEWSSSGAPHPPAWTSPPWGQPTRSGAVSKSDLTSPELCLSNGRGPCSLLGVAGRAVQPALPSRADPGVPSPDATSIRGPLSESPHSPPSGGSRPQFLKMAAV